MLSNFVGNQLVKEIAFNMLQKKTVPHAIMIEGDGGLGKHTLGLSLAQSILCDDAVEYCGKCRHCLLFSAGSHPDFSILSPNKKNLISVEDIRALKKAAYQRPDRAAKKVYIIENASRMNREAQNAFLKILEEPPEYVVFILLAESSSSFLDTIISRCTIFRLASPTYQEAVEFVRKQLPDISAEELELALADCDNNIGRTLWQLQNQDSANISHAAAELMDIIGGRRGYECLKVLHKFSKDPKALQELLASLRSRAALELRGLGRGFKVRHTLSRKDLLEVIAAIDSATAYLSGNVSPQLVINRLCSALIK